MGSRIYRWVQPLRRNVWHPVRSIIDIFHPLPPAAAVVIFMLFANVGQLYELYYSYLEELNPVHILFAVIGLSMLSAALYACHYWLSAIRENIIFANFVRPNIGVNFRRIRWLGGMIWAFLPWAGLATGLFWAKERLSKTNATIDSIDQVLTTVSPPGAGAVDHAARVETWMLVLAIVLVVLVGIAVVVSLQTIRRNRRLLWSFFALIVVLFALAAIMPLANVEMVRFYRFLGPLATLSIEILFVLSIVTLIALLSQKSNFPVLTLVVAAIAIGALFNISFGKVAFAFFVLCLVFACLAAFARLWWITAVVTLLCVISLLSWNRDRNFIWNRDPNLSPVVLAKGAPPLPHDTLKQSFDKWLADRIGPPGATVVTAGSKYPVFIVAVEGGGIYAAAAASLFFAKLQDDQPKFAQHVFAISAVSGGAIGASVFQALVHQPDGPNAGGSSPKCAQAAAAPAVALTPKIANILRADHFSPIVGAIMPDLLGESMGRAESLERSFLQSVGDADASAANRLGDWYIKHWSQDCNDPALVLNTTSAETGYRVAFAPFDLNPGEDRSLFSFSDKDLALDKNLTSACVEQNSTSPVGTPKTSGDTNAEPVATPNPTGGNATAKNTSGEDVALMYAAVGSARFPFILQPYSISLQSGCRWNFVDGGYADPSGAETALTLYRGLNEVCPKSDRQLPGNQPQACQRQDVDIKVILLTSDDPLPNFRSARGTVFADTIAPISAILSVREGLGNQAVAQVCDFFKQQGAVDDDCVSIENKPWKLKLVKIEDEAYALPLGWKISDTTFALVKQLIGDSKLCNNAAVIKTDSAVSDNSCVLDAIERTLSATP